VNNLETMTTRHRRTPRGFRKRFTILFASLFLIGGSTLVVGTYALVDRNLPAQSPASPPSPALVRICKQLLQQNQGVKSTATSSTTVGLTTKPAPGKSADEAKCKAALEAASGQGSKDQRRRALDSLLFSSLVGLAALELLAIFVGWLLSGRVLRPVHSITEAARSASESNLSSRLILEGPEDELRELTSTFNEMLERLERAFASQRMFVANASHELRTPLTAMRTAIDVTLARGVRTPEDLEMMGQRVRGYVDQSDRMIEALLTLSMSQQTLVKRDVIELATAVEDAFEGNTSEIARLNLHVNLNLENCVVHGNRVLLERLVSNLLDNAIHHNVRGGRIDVSTGTTNGSPTISISNSGPKVPESALSTIFEPFNRLDARRFADGGVGLGLAIVQSVAEGHRAKLRVKSQDDGGLDIQVIFTEFS